MAKTPPVSSWSEDYDIFDPGYVKDPAPVWEELRSGGCPIAHTERWGGSWMPTRYEDMRSFVKMVPALSSKEPIVVPLPKVDDLQVFAARQGFVQLFRGHALAAKRAQESPAM